MGAMVRCDIHLDRRRINVRRAFSDVGGKLVLGAPKSHQSRTVRVPQLIATELATAVDSKRPNELIFTMRGGSVMRLFNWRRAVFVLRPQPHWSKRPVPDSRPAAHWRIADDPGRLPAQVPASTCRNVTQRCAVGSGIERHCAAKKPPGWLGDDAI